MKAIGPNQNDKALIDNDTYINLISHHPTLISMHVATTTCFVGLINLDLI